MSQRVFQEIHKMFNTPQTEALKAAVPTAWLVKGGVAFAVVKFPRVAEPGE